MRSIAKIKSLFARSNVTVDQNVNDRIIGDAMAKLSGSTEAISASNEPVIWRMFMNSKVTKIAIAAAVVIAVLVGLYYSGNPLNVTGVVWADVAKRVSSINSFTCRMTTWEKPLDTQAGAEGKQHDMQFWYCAEYGFRMEQFTDGVPTLTVCMLTKSNEGIRIWPQKKSYIRVPLSERDKEMMNPKDMDPRAWVERFLSATYKPLGQQVIDGRLAEGVEINELGIIRKTSLQSPITDYVARLWVDVETQLPVRMEEEGTIGSIRSGGGGDQFQWNVNLTEADIEPVIPDDYIRQQ